MSPFYSHYFCRLSCSSCKRLLWLEREKVSLVLVMIDWEMLQEILHSSWNRANISNNITSWNRQEQTTLYRMIRVLYWPHVFVLMPPMIKLYSCQRPVHYWTITPLVKANLIQWKWLSDYYNYLGNFLLLWLWSLKIKGWQVFAISFSEKLRQPLQQFCRVPVSLKLQKT